MSVPSASGGVDPHPDAPPVHALVAAHARRTPHRPAVVGDHPSVSYQQLWELTTRMLGQLSGHAVAGRTVALRLPPGATQVAATLAAWRAGAEVVCLDQGDPGDRGRDALTQVRPAVLLVEPATTDEFTDWFQAELGVVVEAVTLEASPSPPLLPTAELEPDLHRRACVTFTSGSTGCPKGIPQSHAALSQFLTWFAHEFRIGPGVRVAQWAAPSYDASLSEIFATLAAGGVLHPVPGQLRAHPEALARWLAQQRIHVFQTVPSFATELLKALRRTGIQLPDLQVLLLAGEPLSADLVHQLRHALPDTRLVNLYGPSEALLATWHDLTGPVPEQVPIGVPIPGREVLVVDDQEIGRAHV